VSHEHVRALRRGARGAVARVSAEQTAGVRVAAGAVMLLRPRTVGQVLGAPQDRSADWAVRMLSGRELALGAGALTTGGPARRAFLLAGAVSDAVDAATLVGALRSGELGRTRRTRLCAQLCALGALAAAGVAVRDALQPRM
jgi:hypothetical protein